MTPPRVTRAAVSLAATGAVLVLGAGVASASTCRHSASVTTGSVTITQKANGGSVTNSGNGSGTSGGTISGGNGGTNVCAVNTGIVVGGQLQPPTTPAPSCSYTVTTTQP